MENQLSIPDLLQKLQSEDFAHVAIQDLLNQIDMLRFCEYYLSKTKTKSPQKESLLGLIRECIRKMRTEIVSRDLVREKLQKFLDSDANALSSFYAHLSIEDLMITYENLQNYPASTEGIDQLKEYIGTLIKEKTLGDAN